MDTTSPWIMMVKTARPLVGQRPQSTCLISLREKNPLSKKKERKKERNLPKISFPAM
jgi:hypothetical protein